MLTGPDTVFSNLDCLRGPHKLPCVDKLRELDVSEVTLLQT